MQRLRVNRKFEPLLTTPKPIKCAIGGRGSGKSIAFGDIFTMKMQTEDADIYCLREFQESLSESVHRVFKSSINDRLKLDGWTILENSVIAPNGARTAYKGASRNPDSIQSAQGYKYSWYEEAHKASKNSLDKLLPTIIRNKGSECWFSGNPQSRNDPFSQRFIVPYHKQLLKDGYYEDDLHLIVIINWRDNPWWNEEQETLRAWDYENRPRSEYDWIWEGAFLDTVENSIIPAEWFDAAIDSHEKLNFKQQGKIIAAFDPSDEGGDAKGLVIRQGSVVLEACDTMQGDVNEGCDWAIEKAKAAGCNVFTWDCDGLGVSLKRQVNQAFEGTGVQVVMFKGSEAAEHPDAIYQEAANELATGKRKNRDTFKNRRAQYYWRLRDRFFNVYRAVKKGIYTDPDELISLSSNIKNLDALRAEVCRIPKKPNSAGMIQIMSKVDMLKLGISSPNIADSLMMAQIYPEPDSIISDMDFETLW